MKLQNRIWRIAALAALFPAFSFAESATPRTAYDSINNQYLVSYFTGTTGAYYLYAKILGPDGADLAGPFPMWSSDIDYDTPAPVVFDAANGRWVLAWTPDFPNVHLRLVNGDGSIYNLDGDSTAEPDGDYTSLTSQGFSPELALDPANGLVLAAMSRADTGAVIGQFAALDGSTLGPNFNIHAGTGDVYYDYAVTYDSVYERFLAVFVREPGGAGTYEIGGQFLGMSSGGTVGLLKKNNTAGADPFAAVAPSPGRPLALAVAFSGGDRFLLVWQDGEDRLTGQLINNSGTPVRRDGLQGYDPFIVSNQKDGTENPSLIFDPARGVFLAGFQNYKRTAFTAQGQEISVDGILRGSFPETNFTIADTGSFLEKAALAHNSTDQNNLAVFEYSGVSGHQIGAAVVEPAAPLPQLISPDDGAGLTSLSTSLSWKKIKDPGGTPMTYTVMLCDHPDVTACLPFAVKTAQNRAAPGFALPLAAGVFALGLIGAAGSGKKRAAFFISCLLLGGSLAWYGCAGSGGGGGGGLSPSSVISVKASNLLPATTYYWRVDAEAKDGSAGFQSEIRSFQTP